MRKFLAIVLAGLALAACSDPPASGTVYKMPYTGESYWYSSHCGMYSTVTRTRSVSVYNSKGQWAGSRSESYTEQVCIMTVQDRHVVPPSWEICIRADDDAKHKGCIEVPREVYGRYTVGSHYPNAM